MQHRENFFHLHLISDSTGETLIAASRAVASQYPHTQPIEHVYPMTRSLAKLQTVINAIDERPGIILFTIADETISQHLLTQCKAMGLPCISLLEPVFKTFQSYLGFPGTRKSGAQHELNTEYFNRIDAMNFTMLHDDGQLPEDLEEADIVLLGISRSSKTPTSIYLANRGYKTTNLPILPGMAIPHAIIKAKNPLVVMLIASTDRIHQVRQNRILGADMEARFSNYTDRATIADEIAQAKKLCIRYNWPKVDVSRKSIEETAANILELLQLHRTADPALKS